MAIAKDYSKSQTIVIKNILSADATAEKDWNTGLNAAAGEDATITSKEVLLPAIAKNQVAIPLYGNKNEYYVLNAGDTLTLVATTVEEIQFYLSLAEDTRLTVTATAVSG